MAHAEHIPLILGSEDHICDDSNPIIFQCQLPKNSIIQKLTKSLTHLTLIYKEG